VLRRLPVVIVSGALLIAAFSTGEDYLFFLVYLGILVIGGAYVVTRSVSPTAAVTRSSA